MEYTSPACPSQTLTVPVMAPGVAGMVFTIIDEQLAALVPQLLPAFTQTFPVIVPTVTLIDVVP